MHREELLARVRTLLRLRNTTAALRKGNGSVDTDSNVADFTIGAPNPRNSVFPFVATGAATPSLVAPGEASLLTVTVTPGSTAPGSATGIQSPLISTSRSEAGSRAASPST